MCKTKIVIKPVTFEICSAAQSMIIGPPGDHERPSDASQRPSPHANTSTNWGQGSHGRRTYVKVIGFSQNLSLSFHPSSC